MGFKVVIPARYSSTRLPAKPLVDLGGRPMIQWVVEAACRSAAEEVLVATDDERIAAAARDPRAPARSLAVMTRADHLSGTDRIAEIAQTRAWDGRTIVVNVQGDEPQLDPTAVDLLADLMRNPASDMATLAVPITSADVYLSPNVVKVVCDDRGRALYFSRSPIPMVRDGEPDFAARPARFLQHLGVYAYRRDFLLRIAATPPHPLEQSEKLEQLRVLGTGGTITVGTVAEAHRGIDTPADYAEFVRACRGDGTRHAA
jgi:3-deoxy-manno-octulosonate cytidylyltransferase (CMP-KDO synthetase)